MKNVYFYFLKKCIVKKEFRDALESDFAGYLANLKAEYRIGYPVWLFFFTVIKCEIYFFVLKDQATVHALPVSVSCASLMKVLYNIP